MKTQLIDMTKPTTIYMTIYTLADGSKRYYIGKRVTEKFTEDYYGSGKVQRSLQYVSRERVVLEECPDQIVGALTEKSMIDLARQKYGSAVINIAEGGFGGQSGLKHGPRVLTTEHKKAIAKGKTGVRQNRGGKHWEDEEQLYALWIERDRLSRHKFRKLVVSMGYDDINYQQMITHFNNRFNA